jgi:histone deacetylase 6
MTAVIKQEEHTEPAVQVVNDTSVAKDTETKSEKRKIDTLDDVEPEKLNGHTEILSTDRAVIVPMVPPKVHYIPLKTGLCYDVRMRYHAKIFTSYYEYIDPHPEDPRRIYRIYKILAESGLINDPTLSGVNDIGDLMLKIPVREAMAEEILQVHTKEHLNFIESTTSMTKEKLMELTEKGDSVYFNHDSYLGAKLSCGGAIEACKAVVEGKVKNALAVVRPPGHHAEPDTPGGFCLFSNVAVAAKNILKNYPESVRRIVILDWDVHHGNGTQKAFWDDPRVLYISLHRYEAGKYYPGTIAGAANQVGEGAGTGSNVNIPWPVSGMGDADYIYAFNQVVMPICYEFDPDLVIISSGFDAADGDMIGQCHVTPGAYGHMTHMLKSLAKGNLVVVLEGGYNLDSIAVSALAVAKVLVGEPPDLLKTTVPKLEAVETIDTVIEIQSKYFKCLKPGHSAVDHSVPTSEGNKNSNLQEAIRAQQAMDLFSMFGFVNLPVFNDNIPTDAVNQILASPNIYDADTVIVAVHDPAEVWAKIDPVTGLINPSGSIIIDSTLRLLQWSNEQNYGFIDINIPDPGMSDESLNSSHDVLLYLWDNYIQYFKASKIAFFGFGDSYAGIVHLLGHREVRQIVKASIGFVDRKPLRAIVPLLDEAVTEWFFKNSLIFTSKNHSCWGVEGSESKKPRRKFGRVLKSDTDGLDNIVEERFEEATDFVLDSIEEYESSSV